MERLSPIRVPLVRIIRPLDSIVPQSKPTADLATQLAASLAARGVPPPDAHCRVGRSYPKPEPPAKPKRPRRKSKPPAQPPAPPAPPAISNNDLAYVLSPSQLRCFADCPARWWFKYGLQLPETQTSSLALGRAVHAALGANFAQKIETKQDLPEIGVTALFREAWQTESAQTEFRADEDPAELGAAGEMLCQKFMVEAAPLIEPAAAELQVVGEIGGVSVRGRADIIDVTGKIIDIKTAGRKPIGIGPDHALQLATYRLLEPQASGEAQLITLVKTKTVQLIPQTYTVSDADVRAAEMQYPLAQAAMRSGFYFPNRCSNFCSRRNCSFWRECEAEYGGNVEEA